ncbi:MAG: hypothetical protein ACT4TC_22715 [Myxococcaceae bacterium]
MTVFTIKAHRKSKTRKVESLIREAFEKTQTPSERVLVVYENDAANIYFEGDLEEQTPAKAAPNA